jgi:hypothetical protein
MKIFAKFLALFALIIGGGYVAHALLLPTYYIRYRLTLDVNVDGVMRTGSGVVEVSYQPLPDSLVSGAEGRHFGGDLHGCAITIDLGMKGPLFVVNRSAVRTATTIRFPSDAPHPPRVGASMTDLPLIAYRLPSDGEPSAMMNLLRQVRHKVGPVDIPFENLPLLVHFADIGDKASAEIVDPRDIAATLGPGTKLVRARFEQVTEPVTPMPRSWPLWLTDAHSVLANIGNRDMIANYTLLYASQFTGN